MNFGQLVKQHGASLRTERPDHNGLLTARRKRGALNRAPHDALAFLHAKHRQEETSLQRRRLALSNDRTMRSGGPFLYTVVSLAALTCFVGCGRSHTPPQGEAAPVTAPLVLQAMIDAYRSGQVPLIVPITLLNHYVLKYKVDYLNEQWYLNPHPLELRLLYRPIA